MLREERPGLNQLDARVKKAALGRQLSSAGL